MTRNILLYIASALTAALTLVSCIEENFEIHAGPEGEGIIYVDFTSRDFDVVTTKSTLSYTSESNVFNIMVFIFNADGNKVFGKWFDTASKVDGKANLTQDTWYVENTTETGTNSHGGMMLKAPSGSGYKIYLLANLDADMVKASSDYLQYKINHETDLIDFQVEMNQMTVYRNGYFPMTGRLSNVTITAGSDINQDNAYNSSSNPLTVRIPLKRLDAKIKFIFKVGERHDENPENPQIIKTFTADKWKVVNVPMTGYAMDYATRGYEDNPTSCGHDSWNVPPDTPVEMYADYAPYFFDTEWINFEDFPNNRESGFSFYMLENRMQPKNTDFAKSTDYNAFEGRSRQLKTGGANNSVEVSYINSIGNDVTKRFLNFENANDFSTYVLVKGKVDMTLENDSAGQVLGAEVQYMIHLGDWNLITGATAGADSYTGAANYNTLRNTEYTYTVTINSVHNIRVEVETSSAPKPTENQPGATGDVTIAKEEIALCDAHYTSQTLSFHAHNLIQVTDLGGGKYNFQDASQTLTWKVSTPFSTGQPTIMDGVDVPTGLDYKWVHFRLNKKDESGMYFSDKRRTFCGINRLYEETAEERDETDNADEDGTEGLAGYHNDGLMDVIMLVKYMKKYVREYCQYLNMGGDAKKLMFDNADKMLLSDGSINKGDDAPKISVTIFVDEYYYDKDPIFGTDSPTLWKRFVNKEDRTLHILSNSQQSADGESTATGSVVTIQQKSIQCVYNTSLELTDLTTAWGLENEDENEFMKKGTSHWVYSESESNSNRNNNSSYNGLLNSLKEYGLWNTSADTYSGGSWSTYMNFEVENDMPQLNESHQYLRYSCMTRNRDENGNGNIDEEEIVWYIAADEQLEGIYLGDGVLNTRTRMYNRTLTERNDPASTEDDWKQHIISSTWYDGNSNDPTSIWAEEGFSSSSYLDDKSWADGANRWTVRCIRNLGIPRSKSAKDYAEDEPQPLIEFDENTRTFDIGYLNSGCWRYYTSRELDFHNEFSTENRLYKKFQLHESHIDWGTNVTTDAVLTDPDDDDDYSIIDSRKCPDGWRYPNQREVLLMRNYIVMDDTLNDLIPIPSSIARTVSSLSKYGPIWGYYAWRTDATAIGLTTSHNLTIKPGWGSGNIQGVRCVRDVRED